MADQTEVAMTEQQPTTEPETIAGQTPNKEPDTPNNASDNPDNKKDPHTPDSDTSQQPTTTVTTTAHFSIRSASSITQRLQQQTTNNWFTRAMSIEPIEHLVKVEFDTFGGIKLFK
eukprot:848785_1